MTFELTCNLCDGTIVDGDELPDEGSLVEATNEHLDTCPARADAE